MNWIGIVAVSENNVIGNHRDLPWVLKSDLKNFRTLTEGSTILMGRKTFESFKKPLPNRVHWILSTSLDIQESESIRIFRSASDVLKKASKFDTDLWVIGGAEIFKIFRHQLSEFYLTRVKANVEGDTYFDVSFLIKWQCNSIYRFKKDRNNEYPFDLSYWVKK